MGWESENVGLSPVSDAPVNEHFLQCLAIGCVTALAIVRKLIELLVRAIHDQAEVNGGFTDRLLEFGCCNSTVVPVRFPPDDGRRHFALHVAFLGLSLFAPPT